MSSLLTFNAPGSPIASRPAASPRAWLLALTAVLVAAAAYPSLRLDLGGLQMPLHVIPLILSLPLVLPRVARLPAQIRMAALVFTVLFALSVIRHGSDFGDLVKMLTSALTVIAFALLVRKKSDFVVGVLALAIALLVINTKGILGGVAANIGYEPMRGIANKNAYSIYALPAVLLAGFALLHFQISKLTMAVLVACILSSVFILFTGANRSGWGGIVVIGVLLAIQARNWRALLVVLVLSLLSYGVFSYFGSRETFDYRLEQTTAGYESDDVRQTLFVTALEIAVENPILGVTIQELPYELAKRVSATGDRVDSHNFIGYIAGGSGLTTLFALLALGLSLWRRPRQAGHKNLILAHDLLRLLLVLFVFRGFFSREIFSVASFPMAIGLALGLTLVNDLDNWSLTSDRKATR